MRIALDFDGTYTQDPRLWNAFLDCAKMLGHEVICVTMRTPDEPVHDFGIPVIYTSRMAKAPFVESLGLTFDVWIDDNPHWIFTNSR